MATLRRRYSLSTLMILVGVIGVLFGVVARWPVALVLTLGLLAVVSIEGL